LVCHIAGRTYSGCTRERGAEREEMTGGWKKQHSKELHDLCFWAELWHLGVWEKCSDYRVLVGSIKGRDSLKVMGIDGRLYCILFTFVVIVTYIITKSLCV